MKNDISFISFVVFLAGLKYMPEERLLLMVSFGFCLLLETYKIFKGNIDLLFPK